MVTLVLMIFALVFFVLILLGVPAPQRFQWLGAGLGCWVLAQILGVFWK